MKFQNCCLFFFVVIIKSILFSQCVENPSVCNKPYNEIAFLTTHNAFNTAENNFNLPNQHYSISRQLNEGVRALMIDVYNQFGSILVYHGVPVLGTRNFSDVLNEIKTFLDQNPNEVITLILENHATADDIENSLIASNLLDKCFSKLPGTNWPTLNELIQMGKRIVVFSEKDDASATQTWYHYVWDFAVETEFSVHSPADFINDYNRGDAMNDLFIFNHFISDATTGTGSESDAMIVNEETFLKNRINNHYAEMQKFPNFITLDFYDLGQGKAVVDWLNNSFLGLEEKIVSSIQIHQNEVSNPVTIENPNELDFKVISNTGQLLTKSNATVKTLTLPTGIYFLHSGEATKKFIVVN